ncbi:uncharacterized protein LOC111278357 [Durio zibethinus]|uniref:Uncharacterized protein LOC111278357 n=1 Tax=Durio zibethinus TaxID=66656 RepID=A0A6P5WZ04_DURZI|nr:uncharacterized protein LOC111278357 [Durio zibethinus]
MTYIYFPILYICGQQVGSCHIMCIVYIFLIEILYSLRLCFGFSVGIALLYTEMKDIVIKKLSSRSLRSIWYKWELRGLVVLSLFLQIVLVIFGNRRKYSGKRSYHVAMLVWLTYLLADYVATVALSTLLKSSKEEITSSLVAFWAPFLLLHLGGPDTITAYSLEDNAQWMRHLFGLCVQVGVAFYVYFRFWTNSAHTFIGIPIFIAGINKYGERNWILRSANYEQFKNSLFATRKVENIEEEVGLGMEEEVEQLKDYLVHNRILEKYRYLHQAYLSFQLFKPLFSDLKLRVYKELMSSIYTLPCTNDQGKSQTGCH